MVPEPAAHTAPAQSQATPCTPPPAYLAPPPQGLCQQAHSQVTSQSTTPSPPSRSSEQAHSQTTSAATTQSMPQSLSQQAQSQATPPATPQRPPPRSSQQALSHATSPATTQSPPPRPSQGAQSMATPLATTQRPPLGLSQQAHSQETSPTTKQNPPPRLHHQAACHPLEFREEHQCPQTSSLQLIFCKTPPQPQSSPLDFSSEIHRNVTRVSSPARRPQEPSYNNVVNCIINDPAERVPDLPPKPHHLFTLSKSQGSYAQQDTVILPVSESESNACSVNQQIPRSALPRTFSTQKTPYLRLENQPAMTSEFAFRLDQGPPVYRVNFALPCLKPAGNTSQHDENMVLKASHNFPANGNSGLVNRSLPSSAHAFITSPSSIEDKDSGLSSSDPQGNSLVPSSVLQWQNSSQWTSESDQSSVCVTYAPESSKGRRTKIEPYSQHQIQAPTMVEQTCSTGSSPEAWQGKTSVLRPSYIQIHSNHAMNSQLNIKTTKMMSQSHPSGERNIQVKSNNDMTSPKVILTESNALLPKKKITSVQDHAYDNGVLPESSIGALNGKFPTPSLQVSGLDTVPKHRSQIQHGEVYLAENGYIVMTSPTQSSGAGEPISDVSNITSTSAKPTPCFSSNPRYINVAPDNVDEYVKAVVIPATTHASPNMIGPAKKEQTSTSLTEQHEQLLKIHFKPSLTPPPLPTLPDTFPSALETEEGALNARSKHQSNYQQVKPTMTETPNPHLSGEAKSMRVEPGETIVCSAFTASTGDTILALPELTSLPSVEDVGQGPSCVSLEVRTGSWGGASLNE